MASDQATVVTRFAPSPTGFLHIGGARTALFNWLLARRYGGKFVLRIEDTDRARSTDEAIDAILAGMSWLGLDWDGDAVSQFERRDRHAEVAKSLVETGKAYYCYASPEELSAARDAARSKGENFLGDLWRDRDPADAPEGQKPVLRIKMPRGGSRVIEDAVQGRVEVPNSTLDDMVLLRSDGTPTYMLSVVVDDHDMGITHVVRGDDHLNNAFRQAALFDALGWDLPVFAHIPLIHGPDGKKLSKRHGALGVEGYRDMGFLPDALRNYLLRLGWSHGDDEVISSEDAVRLFSLDAVGASPSRLDFDKLDHINAHYMRSSDPHVIRGHLDTLLSTDLARPLDDEEKSRLDRALPSLLERAKRLNDLVGPASLFCNTRPIDLDDKSAKLLGNDGVSEVLGQARAALSECADWSGERIKSALADVASSNDMKLGKVMQPVRAALTGGKPAADLTEVMEILGQAEVLARLDDQIGQ